MSNWTEQHRHYCNHYHHRRRNGHWVMGLILIGTGSLFLLDRLAYIDGGTLHHYWPFIIAIFGVGHILDARHAGHVAKGGFMIFLAFWLYASLEHVWGLTFQTSWPLVLIALGLRHIIDGLTSKADKPTQENRS